MKFKFKRSKDEKLSLWQDRYNQSREAYGEELLAMDAREELYRGTEDIEQIVCRDFKKQTKHVRNVVAEIIEAQVNSSIPMPKVTAKRKEDEPLAVIIEDMLRNEIDRLPFEPMNDQLSRTVPIQGGAGFLVEWDERKRTHTTSGELVVTPLHPKMIIPQDGVLTGIEDMDYIFLEIPQTREGIKMRYGVDVYGESEEHPEIRGIDPSEAEDMVTQVICFYRNDRGGIGKYSWVGDTILEDLDNYQARRIRKCAECGAPEPMDAMWDNVPKGGDPKREEIEYLKETKSKEGGKTACPFCGSTKFITDDNDYEELEAPLTMMDGTVIPQFKSWTEDVGGYDDLGMPMQEYHVEPQRIPYYCPRMFPVVLIKNTSLYGRFLGGSDVDLIVYQQNTTNRLSAKICDKLMKNGSYITLPPKAKIREDGEDGKVIRLNQPGEKDYMGVFNMQVNIDQDMAFREQVYEEARQMIGVTDSFQGRHDPTATSGKAKEFAAAQSAGRLESKRVMRDWAWSELFRLMFLWKLAYADEPRPVVSTDSAGNTVYREFNRYDFLRRDAAGNFYWLDDFIFSTDVSAPLANNREAMWQETRLNFQQGAFGPPETIDAQILFWTLMAQLHYPNAENVKDELQKRLAQQQMQQQMLMAQQAAMYGNPMYGNPMGQPTQQPMELPMSQTPIQLPPNMMNAMNRQNVIDSVGVI